MIFQFSGLIAVTTTLHCYRSTHIQRFKPILLGPETVDIIGWCTLFVAIFGAASIAISMWKLVTKVKFNFNQVCIKIVICRPKYEEAFITY